MQFEADNAIEPANAIAGSFDFIARHRDAGPLIYSTAEPSEVTRVQTKYGRERLARISETIFAKLAGKAVEAGVRSIVVAGGETSGTVASASGPAGLKVGQEIDTGVPELILDGQPRLAFALKSGNFGADDFGMLGGGAHDT